MIDQRTVIVAAGGTGGHMFPAAAFATEMRKRDWRVVLVTDARGRVYAKDFPADLIEDIPAATIQGINPIKAAVGAWRIYAGQRAAKTRQAQLKPAVVAGFGGYPSFPSLMAARGTVPILIHEQNAVLGRVNRIFAPHAAGIASGFQRLDRLPEGAAERHHVVGNPVRAEIIAMGAEPFPPCGAGGDINVLVIGGSQGARMFGTVLPPAIAHLPAGLRERVVVTQQVRAEQLDEVRAYYAAAGIRADLAPFFSDMPRRLVGCHMMIARAGASTVSEIAAVGRPSLLIPLAIAADDHQTANAEALTAVGAADVVPEDKAEPDRITAILAERLADPHALEVRAHAARSVSKPNAASALADLAERVAA
jgi:UDP-N-acetylglucosamine--N-acetylmuramyl-(pentapeptide) pyrophosphoryl-undecaprenol N-acetylglucosamine transferase